MYTVFHVQQFSIYDLITVLQHLDAKEIKKLKVIKMIRKAYREVVIQKGFNLWHPTY